MNDLDLFKNQPKTSLIGEKGSGHETNLRAGLHGLALINSDDWR